MNGTYCELCKIGKAAKDVFLDVNNSPFDAVTDFICFTENCFKTCPYKRLQANKLDNYK